ncbi:hypothetical protein [Aquimarina aquimarini]|uniref:hypothetical protein n=1 Tax=Aquimarina aquimarini TaxID=1191734 RepID=UPI000D55B7C9|nr:hypothetical protein [Aquimarina aquimarini]
MQPVEVVDTNGIYVQIKESYKEVEATVPKKLLKKYHPVDGPDYYTIDSSNLNKINTYYNNKLPDSNVELYWVSRAKADGTEITKDQEKALIKNATTKKQNYTAYRKLKYVPKNNPQTYWVAVKDLFPVTKMVTKTITIKKPLSVVQIATSFIDYYTRPECREEPETYQIEYPCSETSPAKKGDHTTLNTNICTAYIAVPDNETDIDEEVCKNALIDIRKTKKIGKEWIQVSCSYPLGNTTVTKKGWIENKDIELFSAYNWDKFGFKAFEAGSEYIYDIIGLRENKETESPFIKKLWDTLDVNNNEIIDLFEIESAYRILEVQQAIAKIVCRHKSEWAYEPQQIIDEISVFYDYRISKQKPSIQNALEALKEEKLEGIKAQLEKLMFWDEASGLPYTVPPPPPDPEAKKKPENKRSFGTDTIDQSLFEPLSIPKNTGKTNDYSLPSVPDMDTDLLLHTKTNTATPTTTGTPPVVEEKKAVPQEVKPPERTFPCTDNVWHFHPIAFVKQMRLMFPQSKGDCPELIWGTKVSCEFRQKVVEISKRLECDPNHLMAIMALETGGKFNPFIKNKQGYVGLIQIGDLAAADINRRKKTKITTNHLRYMGAEFQLKYVEYHLDPKKGQLKTLADFYLAVLWPDAVGQGGNDNYIVFDDDATGYKKSAYRQNKSFLKEEGEITKGKDGKNIYGKEGGKTYVWEIREEIERWYNEGKKHINKCNGDDDCNQTIYDLRWLVNFQSQAKGSTNCGTICRYIIEQISGTSCEGISRKGLAYYQLALENSSKNGLDFFDKKSKEAIKYLDLALENDMPIRAGVNHTFGGNINEKENPTTDHYVLIVGKKEIKGEIYYQYWDVGTFRGTQEKYKFKLVDGCKLVNEDANAGKGKDGRKFTVTQIARATKADRSTIVKFNSKN